jgi:hypothetical protein
VKRLLKSWVFWAFVVPPVVGALALGVLRQVDVEECACGSRRAERSWRFGWVEVGSFPITPGVVSETPSAFFTDLVSSLHAHAWGRSDGQTSSLRGLHGGYGVMRPEARDVAHLYQHDPAFSAWLKRSVASGAIVPAAMEAELAAKKSYPPGQFPFGWTPR